MWPEDYDTEEEYLDSLKKEDHYHFTVPFTYNKKKLGDDQYEDGTAIMEVDVDWDSFQHGYASNRELIIHKAHMKNTPRGFPCGAMVFMAPGRADRPALLP